MLCVQPSPIVYKVIHLTDAISDLGFILITAAVVTLVFRYLKQPVVLGYLIAGLLVGPHVDFTPSITDTDSVKVWAEVGVIFLLFSLGLEFSFKKLAQVGGGASVIALVEVIVMMALGYISGQLLNWTRMDSLFLGGILAISSTTIIVRAFDELGLKTRKFVSLVYGVLIIEDLFAILLLVLLSTVAATQSLSGSELLFSTLRLGFFLVLWFVVGIYFVPAILRRLRPLLTDETTLIVAVGLCLVMVIHATAVGFSPELGAFVMGSILAETREGKRIEHLIVPVRDLFAAVFFVSVGMLIDPNVIVGHWSLILVLTILTIGGKLLGTGLGALLSGHSLKQSVQAGMSLAQIGEFSFIIATLGLTLNVTSDFLYPIAVAISAITTFTTPYMIKVSDPLVAWIDRKIPVTVLARLERYQSAIQSRSSQSTFSLLWQSYGMKLGLNAVVVVAITLGASKGLLPYVKSHFTKDSLGVVATALITLIASAPFLWAIVFGARAEVKDQNSMERLKSLQFGVAIFRVVVVLGLVGFIGVQFSSILAASGFFLVLIILIILVFTRYAENFYTRFENRFITNLNDREREEKHHAKGVPVLAPWDANLAEFILSPNSELVGRRLGASNLKERFGVTVALMERGGRRILAPGREDLLMPFDHIFMIGADEQLESARLVIEKDIEHTPDEDVETFGLESIILPDNSPFVEKSIRACGLREAIHGLIVGIERDGKRMVSPDSSMVLKPRDLVWVVGDRKLIRTVG